MAVGEYIKALLEEKGVSVSSLSKEMGLKSRSTLYRLFEDYYSEEKTKEIVGSMMEHIELTGDEKHKIISKLSSERVSSFYKKTRSILSKCYNETIEGGYMIETPDGEISFQSVLKEHLKGDALVVMVNIDDERIIGDVISLLDWNSNLKVHNYLKLHNRRVQTAYEILSLITMWKYKNYVPIINDSYNHKGIFMLTAYENEYNYVNLSIKEDGCSFVDTPITKELYDHILGNTAYVRKRGELLGMQTNRVSDYIELLEASNKCLYRSNTFVSEGAPCFGYLSMDILMEMFKDINYFGFPPEHAYVRKLIDLFEEREKDKDNKSGCRRRFLFTEAHIRHMLATGISHDHLEHFMPMNCRQLRVYFERVAERSENSGGRFGIRFLRYGRIRRPYVYTDGGTLYLSSPEPRSGGGSIMILENPSICGIMNDFVEYVWDNCTYSESDSINMLKKLMSEYL